MQNHRHNNNLFWLLQVISFVLVFSTVLTSCGARKSKAEKEEKIQKIKANISEEKESLSELDKEENNRAKTTIEELGFTIKPVDQKPVSFNLVYEGKEIRGTATGEVAINKKAKQKDSTTTIKEKLTTQVKEDNKKELKTLNKETVKTKETERAEGWLLYLALLIAGVFIVDKVSDIYKKIKI